LVIKEKSITMHGNMSVK